MLNNKNEKNMNKTKLLLRIIKIYPGVAITLVAVLFACGAYWLKSSPIVITTTNEKVVYLHSSSNIIIGDEIIIKKEDGERWSSGELANYKFVISGKERYKHAIKIIADNTCAMGINLYEKGETIILVIRDDDAMCFFDFCQRYAKK